MTIGTDESLLKLADKLAAVLREFPADGQLRDVDPDTMMGLTLGGFVERREVEKPCKCCGTPQLDYSYFRITGGGKLFMAAMDRTRTASSREA